MVGLATHDGALLHPVVVERCAFPEYAAGERMEVSSHQQGGRLGSRVAVVKMLGFGLAVLVDATIIRVLLVPALMRLAGDRNGRRR